MSYEQEREIIYDRIADEKAERDKPEYSRKNGKCRNDIKRYLIIYRNKQGGKPVNGKRTEAIRKSAEHYPGPQLRGSKIFCNRIAYVAPEKALNKAVYKPDNPH